jgi:CubicO group peptidase (beta-lactamase class C family)
MFSSQQEKTLDNIVLDALDTVFPAAQIEVLVDGRQIYSRAFGFLDPISRRSPAHTRTRFDLASLSMLFTSAAFMSYVDAGMVRLDQPVRDILPEFSGPRRIAASPRYGDPNQLVEFYPPGSIVIDARRVTFKHLLAHNSGLPAWLPLHIVEADMMLSKRERGHIDFTLRDMVTGTMFAYPPGKRVVFSDVGYLLLGFALERIGRKPLRQLLRERVVDRLGLLSVCFGELPCDDVAPSEYDEESGRKICGMVHDQNAAALGGVAGHSGLFACAGDVARLGEMFRLGGGTLLKPAGVSEMTALHAEDGNQRRGLGFALHSSHDQASSSPLSRRAYGHLGFTGTSLWVDPDRGLVVAILTNHSYYGNASDDAMNPFRLAFHKALAGYVPVTPR